MKRIAAVLAALVVLLLGCSGGGNGSPPTSPPPGGGGNHAPTVNLNIASTHLAYSEATQLSVTASDVDGDQVTFTWSANLGGITSSGPTATNATFTAGTSWGQVTVTVTASDGKGGTAQASALTYIRNPNPPNFTLRAVAPSASNCTGFALQITPFEAVIITDLHILPDGLTGNCDYTVHYATPFSLAASQAYTVLNPGCIWPSCLGDDFNDWTVKVWGRRPEPDGGTFQFECERWDPSYPDVCH